MMKLRKSVSSVNLRYQALMFDMPVRCTLVLSLTLFLGYCCISGSILKDETKVACNRNLLISTFV